MAYKDVTPPAGGKISIQGGKLTVPDDPILPFIRGDGTGPDIWASSVRVFYAAGTPEAQKLLDFLQQNFPKQFDKVRFGTKPKAEEFWKAVGAKDFPSDVQVGVGIKPVSYSGSVRLIHSAISYAIKFKRKSVTLVHKGNIMKFTEGSFRDWGYEVAKKF